MISDSQLPEPEMSQALAQLEVELKLTSDADGLSALASAPELAGQPVVKNLETTYYDTPDRRLTSRGIALRVRRVGRSYVQTIKTSGKGSSAGLSQRGEWEWPVKGPTPDLTVIDDRAVLGLIGLIRPAELKPIFATKVRRGVHLLRFPDAIVEVALDNGEIVAGRRRQQLHEVELELKEGEVERLFALALALHRHHPLGIDPRSKAARGEALASAVPPAPRFQAPVELPPDITVDDGLVVILGDCLTQWTENLPAALDGSDPEGVHQARVALRRLRSALQLFHPVIGAAGISGMRDQIRTVASSMGPARDIDVFIDEIMGPVKTALPEEPSLTSLEDAARTLKHAFYDDCRASLISPPTTEMALAVGHWIAVRGWREQPYSPVVEWLDKPMVRLADRLLQKRLRAVLKRGRGFAKLTLADRHEVRIATKKLRYAVDFCAPLYSEKATKPFFKQLKRLQSLLGLLQDQAMAASVLDKLVPATADADLARAAGLVTGWHGHAMVTLSMETNAEWRIFAKTKPFWHSGITEITPNRRVPDSQTKDRVT